METKCETGELHPLPHSCTHPENIQGKAHLRKKAKVKQDQNENIQVKQTSKKKVKSKALVACRAHIWGDSSPKVSLET